MSLNYAREVHTPNNEEVSLSVSHGASEVIHQKKPSNKGSKGRAVEARMIHKCMLEENQVSSHPQTLYGVGKRYRKGRRAGDTKFAAF